MKHSSFFIALFVLCQISYSQTVEMLTPTGKEQFTISTKYALVVDKYNTKSQLFDNQLVVGGG
jgi:hypothetical protein